MKEFAKRYWNFYLFFLIFFFYSDQIRSVEIRSEKYSPSLIKIYWFCLFVVYLRFIIILFSYILFSFQIIIKVFTFIYWDIYIFMYWNNRKNKKNFLIEFHLISSRSIYKKKVCYLFIYKCVCVVLVEGGEKKEFFGIQTRSDESVLSKFSFPPFSRYLRKYTEII